MTHEIVVQVDDGRLLVDCSCGAGLSPVRMTKATLDQIAQLAHEHIEDVERAECSCLPYCAGGDGPERDCPVHGETTD